MKKNPFTANTPVLSFFTGAGFLDLGFLETGFKIVWHNEVHEPFVKIFQNGISAMGFNGASAKIQNQKSIIDVGPNEILREAFGGKKRPLNFGIIGGPPCPDFSVGGKNKGGSGDRGRLSEVFINRIIELKPTFFLFENVPGLLRTKKHRHFLDSLIQKLNRSYCCDIKILNTLDFGVPQDRERVFLVGFQSSWLRSKLRRDQYKLLYKQGQFISRIGDLQPREYFEQVEHWFPWPRIPQFVGAKKRFNWPRESVKKTEIPKRPDCPAELMVGTYICDDTRFDLPNSNEGFKPKSSKFTEILEGDVSRKSFKRLHRYRYSPAAAYGNNEVHLHPTLPRRITVREALMIQSVPNEYVIPKEISLSNKFKTIGNGVPVKLSTAVAQSIAAFVKGIENESI